MAIYFDEERRVFHLDTEHTSYQMRVDERGNLIHLYYGPGVKDGLDHLIRYTDRGFSGNPYAAGNDRGYSLDVLPQEYPADPGDYRIAALRMEQADGSRSAELHYAGHWAEAGRPSLEGLPFVRRDEETETLVILLRDEIAGLGVELNYHLFPRKDVIVRSARIINQSCVPVSIGKAASACVDFPYGDLEVIHFHGRHCMERQPARQRIPYGVTSFGSNRGMSSHHHNPFLILCDPHATENAGECYGCMLMYSGNHLEELERDQTGSVRLTAGIHPEGFSWRLMPGESFQTPETILAFSGNGLNGLSGIFHRLIRENVIAPQYRGMRRPVLVNSWEAAYFDFNGRKLLDLAEKASALGMEMLVLDDGWFGHRDDDNAALGDWYVNEEKLGCSLTELSERVHALGMKFGLWVEPEMISEDSDLYRKHPDWALKEPGRQPVLARNQLVLDMSRPEVVDYLLNCLCGLMDSAKIEYLKWDFNRAIANAYSQALPADRQGEVPHRFMLGTYRLLEKLLERYPELVIEGCAGGGGRFDAGMLYYCPQIWCSDDTDAMERLQIQRGTSYGYPACAVGAHVSACPNHQTGRNVPLETRGIVAQSGTFGFELDPAVLSPEEQQEAARQVADYHRYEKLISEGTEYRLTELGEKPDHEAWMFVSPDQREAVVNYVCVHPRANGPFPFLRLRGLCPEKIYQWEGTALRLSGEAWMRGGVALPQPKGDYPATQMHLMAVEG